MDLYKKLRNLKLGRIEKDVDIRKITTFRVGGIASYMVFPRNVDKLILLLKLLKEEKIKYMIIGNGSNLVFSDGIYDGVLINLMEFNHLSINGTVITVGAGYGLIILAMRLSNLGLTGIEFATGIPGTVGGAVYMNAGAYKSDMGYIISEVKVLTPNFKIKTLYNKDLDFHYRSSFLQKNKGYICLEATIVLKVGNKDAIKDLIEERRKKRYMTQPLNFPSAGSVFRNPKDDFAGRLIEESNLKGYKIGGAIVSEKHANFILNTGLASGKDIHDLILYVKDKIKERYGIDLKVEQEFVNWE